jgi:predicted RNA methylase
MSATNRGEDTVRDPEDYYRTPEWCVKAILPHLGLSKRSMVLDPGCGDGAIMSALPPVGRLVGVEMNRARAEKAMACAHAIRNASAFEADFLTWVDSASGLARFGRFDLAIGNPPFKLAMEFVQASMKIADTVVMLLRLPWLASQGRADWMRAHTPSVYVLPKRPEFVMTVRCVKSDKKRKVTETQEPLYECGYVEQRAMSSERPACCPRCGSKVTITTSDATDYGWFCWRKNQQPTVGILYPPDSP